MKSDNLFDTQFSFLDAVKILLLIVTMFSTWNVVALMTPDSPFAFVREIAAVGVVEGAFLGFEAATAKARSRRQVQFATIGFFCSLAVIGIFAGVSGLLEFGGEALLLSSGGTWLGMAWLVKDWVMVLSLVILVAWIIVLASLYRLYSLNDPDKRAELQRIEIEETVITEGNEALKSALAAARPMVAAHRAIAKVEKDYSGELSPANMARMTHSVKANLTEKYNLPIEADPDMPFLAKEQSLPPLPTLDGDDQK